jgi:type IV secretion system protein TrbE
MFHIGAYKTGHTPKLWDHLPWAALIAPGVVLNKDGSFMRAIRFRGPDLDSSTPEQLVSFRARVNNALKRLGSGWCLHIESSRRESRRYPEPTFPDTPAGMVAGLIDAERRQSFTSDQSQFESFCFVTFQYLPPAESKARLADLFIDRGETHQAKGNRPSVNYRTHLDAFNNQVAQVVNLLSSFLPEVMPLDDDELLSYLHDCVSDRSHLVRADQLGDAPVFLDVALADAPFTGGLAPKLGKHYLKTISLRAFSPKTAACMLDQLNDLAIPYRWVARWLPMDKTDATNLLNKLRRQWFAKRKGLWSILKEVITKEPSQLEDTDALTKSAEADAALQALGGDHCAYGYLTLTVTTHGNSESEAVANARQIQQVIDSTGMISQVKDFNAVQAWLGSLPGHAYADIRRPLVNSLNLCDLIPLSSIWAGPTFNAHLSQDHWSPTLMHTKARGGTAFRLNLHQGDVGHTLVAGPTGAGKSTLLNLLAAQWLRFDKAQVFVFDKGGSARVLTEAMAGQWYEPGSDEGSRSSSAVCFQPLAQIDSDADAAWAMEWVCELLRLERLDLDPKSKGQLWEAILNLRSMPVRQRTLSTLHNLIQHDDIRLAVRAFSVDGAHGELLDADHDTFSGVDTANWIGIEMQHLMQRRSVVVPVLTYLFRKLEQRFDGRPTLLVLDEAWLYLADTLFAANARKSARPTRTISMNGSNLQVNTPGLAATRDEAGRASAQLSQAGGGGGGLNARLGDTT